MLFLKIIILIDYNLQCYLSYFMVNSFNKNTYSIHHNWAYGLVVMTSPSHGGGRRFKSG